MAFLGGGLGNVLNFCAFASVIVGGEGNYIGSSLGYPNCSSYYSFIGSGYQNCMDSAAATGTCFSVISGGCKNKICTASCYSFIGSGLHNSISNQSTSIVGGAHNTVSGVYSSVLGGCGNNDNGHAYAGVFGCGITANLSCAFHANNFVGHNLPTTASGISGSFWRTPGLGGWVVMVNP